MGSNSIFEIISKMKVYMAVIFLQFGFSGSYIIIAFCLKQGMNHFILSFYRLVVATAVMAPFALIFERKTRPKMTFSIMWKIVLLGFLEPVLDQNLYYMGLKYTSATFVAAIANILPAVTFIMATIFRLEKVNIKRIKDQSKIIGTILTIGGATIMTFYKGPILRFLGTNAAAEHSVAATDAISEAHWIFGALFCFGSSIAWSTFFILQTFTVKEYPAKLSLSAAVCFMGSIEGGIVSLVMVRDFKEWALGWDSRLLTVVYAGIVCTGIAYYLQSVVNKERGPVFLTAFGPLSIVITAVLCYFIFHELPHLGRIIGAVVIVLGLYAMVWGKTKDRASTTTNEEGKLQELPIVVSPIDKIVTKPESINSSLEINKPSSSGFYISCHPLLDS